MKNFFFLLLTVTLCISCLPNKFKNLEDGIYAEIITNKGTIFLELYVDKVPKTVANFVALVEGNHPSLLDSLKGTNFYKGIIFHRVVPNFVIQAGGYTTQGRKNAGYLFGDEFPKDSSDNLFFKHDDKGVLSMANGGPATNNSQFFVTHRAIPHLDNKHSVFGKTTVNAEILERLKLKFLETDALKRAIDSARMQVVNSIQQNDTIKDVRIIRVGSFAANFNAPEVFETEEVKYRESQKELLAKEKLIEQERYSKFLEDKKAFLLKMGEPKAKKTGTGLRILKLQKSNGKKVVSNKSITANYTIYLADGKKIQSSKDAQTPFVFRLDDATKPMISGFKEGVLKLREGEKARLFIPYSIAYGSEKYGPFPAKADLVFEVEILKVAN